MYKGKLSRNDYRGKIAPVVYELAKQNHARAGGVKTERAAGYAEALQDMLNKFNILFVRDELEGIKK